MLEKELGKDVPLSERASFLDANSDGVEKVSYTRMFTSAEMAEWREKLADASIKIADIEERKKLAMATFKDELSFVKDTYNEAIKNVRDKSKLVHEECYKFYDEESRMMGFYNEEGNLVYSRPALPKEMQHSMFNISAQKTGTND